MLLLNLVHLSSSNIFQKDHFVLVLKEFSLLGIELCATVGGATIEGLVGVVLGSAILFLGGIGLGSAIYGARLGQAGIVLGGNKSVGIGSHAYILSIISFY